MQVAWIGAGRMGSLMAQQVAGAGHTVRVFSKEVFDQPALAAAGVEICATAAQAVGGAELVCLCVFDQVQAKEAVLGETAVLASMEKSAILAIHSTCSATVVHEIAQAAGDTIRVLDAPFSGSVPGDLTMLVGGDGTALEEARDVFSLYAREIFLVGDVGAGQRTKLVNQFLFRANIAAADSALRLLESYGVRREDLVPALMQCSSRSFALSTFAGGQSIETAAASFQPYLDAYSAAAREDNLAIDILLRRGQPDA